MNYKNIISMLMSIIMGLNIWFPVNAAININNEIELPSASEKVQVYKNQETNEKYAFFNINDVLIGEEILLYYNENTGEKVSIMIEKKDNSDMQRSYGESSWSAGWMPSGSYTIKASAVSDTGVEASFKTDVDAYPVRIVATHSPTLTGPLVSIVNEPNIDRINDVAGTNPAEAKMTFSYEYSQAGFSAFYRDGMLKIQINADGQVRTIWDM